MLTLKIQYVQVVPNTWPWNWLRPAAPPSPALQRPLESRQHLTPEPCYFLSPENSLLLIPFPKCCWVEMLMEEVIEPAPLKQKCPRSPEHFLCLPVPSQHHLLCLSFILTPRLTHKAQCRPGPPTPSSAHASFRDPGPSGRPLRAMRPRAPCLQLQKGEEAELDDLCLCSSDITSFACRLWRAADPGGGAGGYWMSL